MPSHLSSNDYFKLIKDNHQTYLKNTMVSHLDNAGVQTESGTIATYIAKLEQFRDEKSAYLNEAVKQPSLSEKMGNGVLSALLGAAVGGVAYFAGKNKWGGGTAQSIESITTGAFSGVLATGASTLIYEYLSSRSEKPASADEATFLNTLQLAGFSDEHFKTLSEDLVKSFHFRECVLLGLKDNGVNMRDEFLKGLKDKNIDETMINIAIEADFLKNLDKAFNQAFAKINQVDEAAIDAEAHDSAIIHWINGFFQDPKKRRQFTQEMQIRFMDDVLRFLEHEMGEKSFMGKYPLVVASFAGLMGGAAALGIAAIVMGGPISWGVAGIALLAACVVAATTYLATQHINYLHYKRGSANRNAIKHAIDAVTQENRQLKNLIKNAEDTSAETVEKLVEFKAQDDEVSLLGYLFGEKKQAIAMGAGQAWIREYAARYRHSCLIEDDLEPAVQDLVDKSAVQTTKLATAIKALVDKDESVATRYVKVFIDDTQAYLANQDNKKLVEDFGLIEKIREQVLSAMASAQISKEEPLRNLEPLVTFYCAKQSEGGLAGNREDLRKVCAHAALFTNEGSSSGSTALSTVTEQLSDAYNQQANNAFILKGDRVYRDLLGLSVDKASDSKIRRIDSDNIDTYLQASFDFLIQLSGKNEAIEYHQPLQTSLAHDLYRLLLLKQLAILCDPNDPATKPALRQRVETFVRGHFGINAVQMFDDILNQALFIPKPDTAHKHDQDDLAAKPYFIERALLMDFAASIETTTPHNLITHEVETFRRKQQQQAEENSLFAIDTQPYLRKGSEYLVQYASQAVKNTKKFIQQLDSRPSITETGVREAYLHACVDEIKMIRNSFRSTVTSQDTPYPEGHHIGDNKWRQADILLHDLESFILQTPPAGDESRHDVVIEDSENTVISPETKDDPRLQGFIEDIKGYCKKRKLEGEPSSFNFFAYSKDEKLSAAKQLQAMLENLKQGKPDNANQLDIQALNQGRLGKIIAYYCTQFGVDDLDTLLDLFPVVNKSDNPNSF